MSKTINSYYYAGSGGGGGVSEQDAILMVTVTAGSSLTATKGGVTLTPSLWVANDDSSLEKAMFVFSQTQFDSATPWTITSTDGTHTASTTVLITANKEYEVTLLYSQLLYNAGNEYTAITGGWDGGATDSRYQATTKLIKNTDNINVVNVNGGSYGAITNNQIDLTPYSIVEIAWWRGSNAADYAGLKIAPSFPIYPATSQLYAPVSTLIPSTDPSNPTISQLDISNLTGNYKIGIQGALYSGIFFSRVELK